MEPLHNKLLELTRVGNLALKLLTAKAAVHTTMERDYNKLLEITRVGNLAL